MCGRRRDEGMTKTAITGAATDSATIRKIADEAFTALNRGGGQVLLFSHGRCRAAFVCCVGSAWVRDRAIDLSRLEVFGGRHRRRQCNARRAAARTAPRYRLARGRMAGHAGKFRY